MNNEIILGIDPGLTVAGFSLLKKSQQGASLIEFGYLSYKKNETLVDRVGAFYTFFLNKIMSHQVTMIALETPFLGKNKQSFLKLGYVRGILYLLAHQQKLELREFAPTQVKSAVTGFGGASKEQVAYMVVKLFPRIQEFGSLSKLDVTDAIAVGLCGYWAAQRTGLQGKFGAR